MMAGMPCLTASCLARVWSFLARRRPVDATTTSQTCALPFGYALGQPRGSVHLLHTWAPFAKAVPVLHLLRDGTPGTAGGGGVLAGG